MNFPDDRQVIEKKLRRFNYKENYLSKYEEIHTANLSKLNEERNIAVNYLTKFKYNSPEYNLIISNLAVINKSIEIANTEYIKYKFTASAKLARIQNKKNYIFNIMYYGRELCN